MLKQQRFRFGMRYRDINIVLVRNWQRFLREARVAEINGKTLFQVFLLYRHK